MTSEVDVYNAIFRKEYESAVTEFNRLHLLFNEVCWYNFEVKCRNWSYPWHATDPDSVLDLRGHRYVKTRYRQKRGFVTYEEDELPVYFEGPTRAAPPLPPEIVLNELRDASKYMEECKEQLNAATDWAPGGAHYYALKAATRVGRKRKFSDAMFDGGGP